MLLPEGLSRLEPCECRPPALWLPSTSRCQVRQGASRLPQLHLRRAVDASSTAGPEHARARADADRASRWPTSAGVVCMPARARHC
eukprot:364606-Chlamydomonas_euryale.AAC.6